MDACLVANSVGRCWMPPWRERDTGLGSLLVVCTDTSVTVSLDLPHRDDRQLFARGSIGLANWLPSSRAIEDLPVRGW